MPGQLKPLPFHCAGCGGALLTLWSVCGQWAPHTGSTEVFFFLPISSLQIITQAQTSKHKATCGHACMHICEVDSSALSLTEVPPDFYPSHFGFGFFHILGTASISVHESPLGLAAGSYL